MCAGTITMQKSVRFVTALLVCLLESTPILAEGTAPSEQPSPTANSTEGDFLRIQPLPAGIADVTPIPGAVNVPFADCQASWPDGYKQFRNEDFAVPGHARKRDIYAWLRAKQAFETRDCGCDGKVAPWEPVEAIYAELVNSYGTVQVKHTAEYDAQANVLTELVERLCGGRF